MPQYEDDTDSDYTSESYTDDSDYSTYSIPSDEYTDDEDITEDELEKQIRELQAKIIANQPK